MRALLLLTLLVPLSLSTGCAHLGARDRQTVAEQYELGLTLMGRGQYVRALEQFNRVRNYHRDDPHAVKAELAIGDVYFKKAEWDQARVAYEDFARMHPRHPDLDYVVYKVGLSMYKKAPKAPGRDQTWTKHSVNSWSGFSSRFPDSTHRDEVEGKLTECRERLANKELRIAGFYKRRKAWPAVSSRAEGLFRVYPKSASARQGLVLLAEASAWQGERAKADLAIEKLRSLDPAAADQAAAAIALIPAQD
jgi:outer membrane protein assembly factor BamD